MSDAKITRKDKCNVFWSGILVPTERAFKGYSILFSLWAIGSLLAITMIRSLTLAHADVDGAEDTATIKDNLHSLEIIMFIAGGIFAALAVISMICRVSYRGVAGKSPEDVEDDIQKMLRSKSRLLSGNDD